MNFIFGSVIYFSLFGPMNIIGYEGKSISILESMPISPSKLIKQKYYFWVVVALTIFIPSTIITFKFLNFDWLITLKATFMTFLFTSASVWVTVCLSAIFARYDTVVLQQHSTFFGKMATMSLISIILPVKNISWLNFYSVLIFILLTYLCYLKAQYCLAYRQDKEGLSSENYLTINCFILLMCFVAIENNIRQFFISLVPDSNTGIWSWCLSLFAIYFFMIIAKKKETPLVPKLTGKSFLKIISISVISIILTYGYFVFDSNSLVILKSDIAHIIGTFSLINIIKPICSVIFFLLFSSFLTAVIRRIEENFFTKSSNFYIKLLGGLLAILLVTNKLMFPIMLFVITLQLFKDKENRHSIVFYSSVIYFSSLFAYLIF